MKVITERLKYDKKSYPWQPACSRRVLALKFFWLPKTSITEYFLNSLRKLQFISFRESSSHNRGSRRKPIREEYGKKITRLWLYHLWNVLVLQSYGVTEKQLFIELLALELLPGIFFKILVNLKEVLISVSENPCSSPNETRNFQLQKILQSA